MLPGDQLEELGQFCQDFAVGSEGSIDYVLLRGLRLPASCTPAEADALLCPAARDGYPTRLFFSTKVLGGGSPNWSTTVRILERNWIAFSYKDVPASLRLAQVLAAHLRGLG